MSDLLKEAIADAKAVRETALQNAKMALEEAFTPHLKSMLSAKLAEDEFEDDEDEMGEPEDEMGDEEDAEEMARSQYREDDDEDAAVDIDIDADGDDEEEEMEGVSEEDIIEIDGVKYAPIVTEDEFEEDVDVDESEELDLEAVIKELEQEIAESEDLDEEELDEYSGTKAEKRAKDGNVVRHNEEVEEITEEDEEEDDDDDEVTEQSSSSGIGKGTGVKQASAADEEDPGKGKVHEHVENLQTELNEYKEAVTYLRDKLHEVNILNAKLLYTNKLFREYALNNDQKLKIVETFDRAQTTREIKLVYSTLAESFGDNGFVSNKNSVKESASRKTATTAPQKKIISEENQVASRFQKLAGILKD